MTFTNVGRMNLGNLGHDLTVLKTKLLNGQICPPLLSWFISTHLHYHPYIISSYPFSSLLLILILPISHPYSPHLSSLFTLNSHSYSFTLIFSFSFALSSHTCCPFFSDFSLPSHPFMSHQIIIYSSYHAYFHLLILICPFFSS